VEQHNTVKVNYRKALEKIHINTRAQTKNEVMMMMMIIIIIIIIITVIAYYITSWTNTI
jgi:uncharacterized protein (UPF0333 family)